MQAQQRSFCIRFFRVGRWLSCVLRQQCTGKPQQRPCLVYHSLPASPPRPESNRIEPAPSAGQRSFHQVSACMTSETSKPRRRRRAAGRPIPPSRPRGLAGSLASLSSRAELLVAVGHGAPDDRTREGRVAQEGAVTLQWRAAVRGAKKRERAGGRRRRMGRRKNEARGG